MGKTMRKTYGVEITQSSQFDNIACWLALPPCAGWDFCRE
jgi:hypothetical protein